MYLLAKQFSDKFKKLYFKSLKDNEINKYAYIELVKVYEDYKKNKRTKLNSFLN